MPRPALTEFRGQRRMCISFFGLWVSLESGTIEVKYEPIQNTSHCDGNKDL